MGGQGHRLGCVRLITLAEDQMAFESTAEGEGKEDIKIDSSKEPSVLGR